MNHHILTWFKIAIGLVITFVVGWYLINTGTDFHKTSKSRVYEDHPTAAFERQQLFLSKRLPTGQNFLPMDPYRPAINQIKNRARFSTQTGQMMSAFNVKSSQSNQTAWQWLGPGNVGGRTRTLVFHPEEPQVMYAGGVSGGVWKTENGGASWRALADNMANINIGALAIDPQQPNTLYAGTGELYRQTLRPYSSMTGAGLFKTTDGGLTWFQAAATVNEQFLYISDVVVSPNNHNRIYVAANSGVWRSDDGGVNFVQTLNPTDDQGGNLYEGCSDLSIRSDLTDDWLLVSCASRSTDDRYYLPGLLPDACEGPCDARVYLNQQAQNADEWQVVLTEPGMGRTQMSIHQANQNIIYAVAANTDGGPDLNGDGEPDLHNGLHALFRSDDGGLNWQATVRNTDSNILNTQLFSYAEGAVPNACGEQPFYYSAGWYNQALAVSPVDPDVVWVAGMEIYRSDDGGRNFGMASHWDALFFEDPAYEDAYVHADMHALVFHPDYDGVDNKTLYVTNDGGIYLTEDDTEPVQYGNSAPCVPHTDGIKWRHINNNYGVTQFYAGGVFANGKSYMAGAQDNGTQRGYESGTNSWVHISGGDGADLIIDPSDDNHFYVSSQNANIHRTTDGGQTFNYVGLPGGGPLDVISGALDNSGLNKIFITPYEMDPNDSDRLFLGGQYLWRSDNRGDNWIKASPPTGYNYTDLISALAIAPGDSNHVLYANSKLILLNTTALASDNLFSINTSRPRTGWVSSLTFEPNNPQVAYATYSTFGGVHVWKSTNGGRRWTPLDGSGADQLPDVPVHKLVIDPNNTERLYIGTDLGVFVSLDGGESWVVENTGFSQVITEDLVINQPTNGSTPQLYAFTYGRGVWRVPLTDLDALPDVTITGNISGLWNNPEQAGHGLQLEVLDTPNGQSVLAAWFVFHHGEPVWLIGLGQVEKNQVELNMTVTDGTGFPVADFDSTEINQTHWGTVKLVFESDRKGQLIWSSVVPEFNNGSMSIERFTQVANNTSNIGINGCHSGSWYNPDQDGHGFMIEVVASEPVNTMLITWYTYVNGQPYWVVGSGPVDGNNATILALSGTGGMFPPLFESNQVVFENWGELNFTLLANDQAHISWNSGLEDFPAGEMNVVKFTQLSGYACQ